MLFSQKSTRKSLEVLKTPANSLNFILVYYFIYFDLPFPPEELAQAGSFARMEGEIDCSAQRCPQDEGHHFHP